LLRYRTYYLRIMSLSFSIAWRYLFGKKSTNAINIITGISVFGITLGTAALILILSVFNGFESLLSGIFDAFNPDLKVIPIQGKRFQLDDEQLLQIQDIEGIVHCSKTVEEIALFEYRDKQEIGIIKGVDANFKAVTGIDTTVISGKYSLKNGRTLNGVFSLDLASRLSLNVNDRLSDVKVYMPLQRSLFPGSKEFKIRSIYPSGVYNLKNTDGYQYVLASYKLVNHLLQTENSNSFLEIKLQPTADETLVRNRLLEILGNNFTIKNKYEQEETYLKIIKIEKWVSFLIASLTILLIVFNLVGSLWMIVLDKKKDLSILKSMGYHAQDIRRIILNEGVLISAIGIVLGIILALVIYYVQTSIGIVAVPDGFTIDAYPVKLKIRDFIIVSITVLLLSFLASLIPARRASQISAFVHKE